MSRLLVEKRNRAGELYGYSHWCAGCRCVHTFHVVGPGPVWTFNGNMEKPTFSPSMRYFIPARKDVVGKIIESEVTLCHYFLTDGEIDYLADSSDHELRGKHPLQPIPENYGV